MTVRGELDTTKRTIGISNRNKSPYIRRIWLGLFASLASLFVILGSGLSWADSGAQSAQSGGGRATLAMRTMAESSEVAKTGNEQTGQQSENDGPLGITPEEEASQPAVQRIQDLEDDGDSDPAVEDESLSEEELEEAKGSEEEAESEVPQSGGSSSAPSLKTSAITPLAIPAPPYLKWSVKDAQGNLVGGATIQVQGPRGSQSNTNTAYSGVPTFTVTDCVAEPCAASGGDLDPEPGVFAVNKIGSAANDHSVSSTSRYRIRQSTPPEGYKFAVATNPWQEIPGSGSSPSAGAWVGGVYTYADFQVVTLTPVCEPGNIYGISSSGQIQHIAPNGTVTAMGNTPNSTLEFNGLGIGTGGTSVFAYSRPSGADSATVWRYDTISGNWTSTNQGTGTQSVQFVAGAVSYDGNYYMGGYNSSGTQFHIWEYAPATNSVTKKGWVNTSSGAGGTTNGDMAFDSAGNLYVVRGSGTTTTIFSATYGDFVAAAGGQIPSSVARSQSGTVNNVNGVAFDSNARIYLGQASSVTWYQMPDWTPSGNFTSNLSDSTDLASCDTPPSITIQKDVLGRVNPTDQFRLQLRQGTTGNWNNPLGDNTTTGTANGIQEEKVGPQVTPRNVTYSFRETFVGAGNSSANYVSSWSCKAYNNVGSSIDPNPADLGSGAGTSGTVTIPEPGDLSSKKQIICTFSNSPLVAHVNITKNVLDKDGQNPSPEPGWTVGAIPTAVSGTVTAAPSAQTLETDASGTASWRLSYNTASASANVAVSETQQPGHQFISGNCRVTDINGEQGNPITFSSEAGGTVPGVKPGETVDCTFTNQELDNTLQLVKVVDNQFGGTAAVGDFPLHVTPTSPPGSQRTFVHNVAQSVVPGTYTVGETQLPGYELEGIKCVQDGGEPFALDGGEVTIEPGDLVTVCTLTNKDLPGQVSWSKVASGTSDLLSGSEWKLVGPSGTGSAELSITDCGAAPCAGPDQDPAAGKFRLEGLSWGSYSLIETRAPAGYELDETPISVTINGTGLSVDLGDIDNDQHEGPEIPVTGGLGADTFLLGGGILALIGALVAVSIHVRRSAKRSH